MSGDVKFVFYDANQITKHEKIFHFVFTPDRTEELSLFEEELRGQSM